MPSPAPSPLNPNDPNYSGTPYRIDFPAMTGDLAQTLASLISLKLSIVQMGPKPDYDVHGHRYNFKSLMEWFDASIETTQRQLLRNQPWQSVSRGL